MTASTWTLGLEGWVIQDGDFDDVESGQELRCGIEIVHAPHWTAPTDSGAVICSSPLAGNEREFVGELVFREEDSWVMDVGMLACGFDRELPLVYADREMPEVRVGDRFAGQGSFHVLAAAIDLDFHAAPPHH